jgi:PAS domain S-box-containing protein
MRTMAKNTLPSQFPDIDWYKDVVSGAPDIIDIITHDGTIIYSNAIDKQTALPEIIGTSIYKYFFPEFHDLVRKKIASVFKSGLEDFYELATDYDSSQVEWYMTRLGPILRNGKVVAVSLFIRNITKLKQEEEALSRMNDVLEERVNHRTAELRAYANRLEVSERLIIELRNAERFQDVFSILAKHSLSTLGADLAGIYEIDDKVLRLAISLNHIEKPPDVLTTEKDALFYRLLQTKETRYIPLTYGVESDCDICGYIANHQIQAMLVAPLRSGSNVEGVIYLGYRSPREYSSDDEQLLNTFVESGSITLHRLRIMEQLKQNILQREHELKALYEIVSIASEAGKSESLLQQSLKVALNALKCRKGVIHLVDPETGKLKEAVSEYFPTDLRSWLVLSGLYEELWNKALSTQSLVRMDRLQSQSYPENTGAEVKVLAYVGVPIQAKGITLGVLSLFGEDGAFMEEKLQIIQTIADQIGLSLESLTQRKQGEEALILEERQRLARDLHDSVSQSLYGLVLSADIGNKFLKMKAYPELSQTLEEIGETALQSLKEMRLMLFELRPLSFETVGLQGALELRLNTVERRAGMESELIMNGSEIIPRYMDLEIYRIITEALNNSLKHSFAKKILVSVEASDNMIQISVVDNGKGFIVEEKHMGGIGLSSMRERATRIGGKLQVDSEKEKGTTVKIIVPCRTNSHEQEIK